MFLFAKREGTIKEFTTLFVIWEKLSDSWINSCINHNGNSMQLSISINSPPHLFWRSKSLGGTELNSFLLGDPGHRPKTCRQHSLALLVSGHLCTICHSTLSLCTYCIWPNGIIFHQPGFSRNSWGFPFQNATSTFWAKSIV